MAGLAPAAWGQQQTPPPEAPDVGPRFSLQAPAEEKLNKIGLNYRLGLNINVNFKRLGGRAFSDIGPVSGTTVNREYDNGFNRVDVTGNNHGGYQGTWNWGYDNDRSRQGDHILLQSYSSAANAVSKDNSDDPYHGGELTYSHEFLRGKHWRAGLETGLGYTRISVTDDRTLHNSASRISDAYYGPGVEALPGPPGPGTFDGPGAVISAAPTVPGGVRTSESLAGAATITGTRQLDADLFMWRVGPYVEFPITERLSAILSGGFALAVAHDEFSYHEVVNIFDPVYLPDGLKDGGERHSGSSSQTDVLVGGYVGGSLSYQLTEELSLVAGAQFQAEGQAVNNARGKQAVLDLGKAVFVSLGVTYSF
jgi:hypothetical protein